MFPNRGFGRQVGGITEAEYSKVVITTGGHNNPWNKGRVAKQQPPETMTWLQGGHNSFLGKKKMISISWKKQYRTICS